MTSSIVRRGAIAIVALVAAATTPAFGQGLAAPLAPKPLSRLSQAEIRKHVDRQWVEEAATRDLMDYWFKHSVEPNGFIQENLDREWKPWGTQREATVNGQGRQLYSMAVAYEMTRSPEHRAALERGLDFLLKMRDLEFGGYYDRVGADLSVISDTKSGYMSFALYSLAISGRVLGEQKYLDAAMELFREVRDKMRDGPFIGSGTFRRDFMQRATGRGGAGRGGAAAAGARGRGAGAPPAGARASGPANVGATRAHGTNLHMFEALLALYEATKSDEVWYQLQQELDAIERLFNYEIGYFPESYDAEWKPVGNPSGNPGHLFEWASLLSRAVELGADPKFIVLGSRNLDLGLKSYNDAVGGLGGVNASGQPTQMLWWPQNEVIKATANYAILHGRSDLWPYFHKTLDFVKKEYLDPEYGGWFPNFVPGQPRSERGPAALRKGSVDGPEWGAYHIMSMYEDLWRIAAPDYAPWPTRR